MNARALAHTLLVPLLLAAGAVSTQAQNPAGVRDRGFDDAARAATEGPRGTLYILTVGVGSYTGGIERLRHTLDDARAFADSLSKGGAELFDRVVVDSLFDAAATKPAISDAFTRIAAEADTSDTFVFFYSGHGTVASKAGGNEQFFLAPINVTTLAAPTSADWLALIRNGIAHWELQGWLSQISAQAKLVVLDACQSGAFVKHAARDGLDQYGLQQVSVRSGTAILAATGPSSPAYEVDGIKHGLFTQALLESLAPSNPPKDRTIRSIANATGEAIETLASRLSLDQTPWDHVPAEIGRFRLVRR